MVHTFAGQALDPLGTLRRPRSPRRTKRPHRVPTPAAWLALWMELLTLGDKDLAWNSWQALVSSMWSTPKSLAQEILLWPNFFPVLSAYAARGLTPQRLMVCLELLVIEGRLSAKEAAKLETALLAHIDAARQWHSKETICRSTAYSNGAASLSGTKP